MMLFLFYQLSDFVETECLLRTVTMKNDLSFH